jgi:hypothetical protein
MSVGGPTRVTSLQRRDVAPRDARVGDVADDRDAAAVE